MTFGEILLFASCYRLRQAYSCSCCASMTSIKTGNRKKALTSKMYKLGYMGS